MLSKIQIEEIKEHLSNAQNPLFFFDNDPDGLCSFLLLQRYIGRGKGVPIRSFPELSKDYLRKINELSADYIFILDKPLVSKDFFEEVEKFNIPVVWIDHHFIKGDVEKRDIPKFVNYYNPFVDSEGNDLHKTNQPTTYLCYQVSKRKEDLWIALIGCISDKFFPDFYFQFKDDFPDLVNSLSREKDAFEILYKSQIGKIARIMGFALKDRTTNVTNMVKFLMKVKTPYEVLEESKKNSTMHNRFNEIDKKYRKFLEKAKNNFDESEEILFFEYGGDLSISADLANELSFIFPKKIIIVAYIKGIKANISVRGKKIREIILKSIKNLDDASGGGHEDAVGVTVRVEDLKKFKENIKLFSKI